MCWPVSTACARLPSCRRSGAPRPGRLRFTVQAACLMLLAVTSARAEPGSSVRGLPFTRHYSFEDVGRVSRGARLGFDAYGRVAVMQDGVYAVLNDSTWVDLANEDRGGLNMINVIEAADGRSYYGAYGSWGLAEIGANGKIRPRPLVPAARPGWTSATNFSDLLATADGVYFAGFNGIVFHDTRTGGERYFPVTGVSRVFAVGDRVYASIHQQCIHELDIQAGVLRRIEGTEFEGSAVEQAAPVDPAHTLIATRDGRLRVFDGTTARPWLLQEKLGFAGRISALKQLPGGELAVAINGRGLYVLTADGDVRISLISLDYQGITALAANEPSVLWAATESGIEKILYNTAVTRFGQPLGLPVSWPQIVRWRDRVYIASSGTLYESFVLSGSEMTHFRPVAHQPVPGVWALAATAEHLLVGNAQGVFAVDAEGRFVPVLTDLDVARLVLSDEGGVCYAIGAAGIAALRWTGDRWVEAAPRIPGVGYPSITLATRQAAWIELGPDRAARIVLHGGRLQSRVFSSYPWDRPSWVNVGRVGDTIVLAGPAGGRIYFDEKSEQLSNAPELAPLLDQAPYPVQRVRQDASGTLWVSHEHGIFTMTLRDGAPVFDTATFDIIDDRVPRAHPLPDGDVWISSGYSLYHVDQRVSPDNKSRFKPALVSLVGGPIGHERFLGPAPQPTVYRVPYDANDLRFRFFAGSHASYRPPVYEFRLNQGGNTWSTLGNGSLLNFSQLREGRYHLDVRVTDQHGAFGQPTSIDFEILSPWYRTAYAYLLYAGGACLALFGLVRWAGHRTRNRNLELEKLVQDRTNELKRTMQRLNEETRNAATLAERDRLACEIHDSLQQGLSGLILQLDATLKLSGLSPDVRSRLTVARNMVSFTRHEVQHAVWDMESPLLEGTELEEALRKITALINPGTLRIDIEASGANTPLSPATKHHLLRIGQEAITNAVRHAHAQRIVIRLEYRPDAVTLSISDDGCGFDAPEVLANGLGHFGLRGLRGRAEKIGGELQIDSAPGKGTTIRVTAPASPPDQPHPYAASHASG